MTNKKPRNENNTCKNQTPFFISSFSHIIIIFLTFLIIPNSAFAVRLNQALSLALENNANIKLEESRLNRVKATKGDAISEFLPDIRAVYQRGRQKNDATDLNRGDLDKMNDQDIKQISLVQPLFDGFKSYNYSKEIDYNIKSADSYYKAQKDEILFEGIAAYLNLLKARKLLKIKIDNANNSAKLLKLIKQRNKLGKVGGSELIRYQTTVSSAISEKLSAEKDMFRAEEEYNKIFGKVDKDLYLPTIIKNKIPNNPDELLKLAIANNHNLRSYHFKVQSSKSAVDKSKGEFSPKLELSASMSDQRNVTYLNNSDLRSEAVYLNLTIPIFHKGIEYFNVGKANEDLQFAKMEYEANKENIAKFLNQTYKEYLFFDNIIKSHNELTKLTESRINKIKQQVKIGRGDVIDLYAAKLELNKILEEDLSLKVDHVASYYKLLMIIGKFEL